MRLLRATAVFLLAVWAAPATPSSIAITRDNWGVPHIFVPHLREQVADHAAFVYRPMPFALTDLEGPTTTEALSLP
jgi:hypothetical protein